MSFSFPDSRALFPFAPGSSPGQALSLSKDCTPLQKKERGSDRLSPNGFPKAEANR